MCVYVCVHGCAPICSFLWLVQQPQNVHYYFAVVCRGVGVQMTEALYRAPALSDILPSIVFPQNLPSIVCGHMLNPHPGQTVIDMCAAPGKTVVISHRHVLPLVRLWSLVIDMCCPW